MDRNREARRAAAGMAAAPNGLSRRRHRSSSLRDSPEEDRQVDLQEPGRLRDRGIKKDQERERERERERDRERERSSRNSKRRRGERSMNAGDDSSVEEESVNDEEDDDEDVDVAGAFTRMLPPLPNPVVSAAPAPPSISTNHYHSHNHNHNNHHHHQHRKSFPPSIAAKVFKAAPPSWKAADEMIGVSVPRKARSVSTKRSHDWVSGGEQMIHRQYSTSPVRQGIVSSTPSPAAVREAPLSPPSSSNASIKKKIKPNGGGSKPRPPPKSSTASKSPSSNNTPEELEIEIAEVLYGLMTQSQAPKNDSTSKLELNNKSSSDAKSRVSSPVSNSPSAAIVPQNSSSSAAPLSAVAPKRKRPRQVPENNLGSFSGRSSPMMKVEVDQTPKTETSSPNLERNSGSAAENGDLANLGNSLADVNNQPPQQPPDSMKLEASVLSESTGALTEEAGESRDVVLPTQEEVNFLKKESTAVGFDDNREDMTVTLTVTATKVNTAVSEMESKAEEKFQIDLMAPSPQLIASPEREGEIDFEGDKKRMVFDMEKRDEMMKDKEDDKEETVVESDDKRPKPIIDAVEMQKPHINKERIIDIHFDLEKPDSIHKSHHHHHHHTPKSQSQPLKVTLGEETAHTDKTAQPSSLPLPVSVASWPGGLPPPMGYIAPLQGVVSMDPSAMSLAPIQPLFSQPRPKRCATHCHIARNIHYYQQLMKMNPFWPTAASGSAPMFGTKPCNLNVMPSTELHGNVAGSIVNSAQDKGQGIAIFPGHAGKDKVPQAANIPDSAHRKQQILLQQALPPVAPNNILHGPAFIFPFNQQQAAVTAASSRPGSLKSPSTTSSLASTGASSSSTMSASSTAPAAATALSFNYPNMSANEMQYLVLQNNPYPFPIPAVGAPPNFRGTHAQAMTMFNGSYYSSRLIHPSHLQQQQPPPSQPQQIQHSHQNTSSGSSSSQKHLQNQQQRQQQGSAISGGTGNGNLHNFPAPKNRSSQQLPQHLNQHITPPQAHQLESEVGGEDSPSTADSRVSRATMNIYGQNFAMPIHPQNFALMTSPAAMTGATAASGNCNQNNKKQQHQYQQQQGFKCGVDIMPPQTFAMSFGPINGSATASGIDISAMAQNHAILQSLPEVTRQSCYQIMQVAASEVAQQRDSRMKEDGKSGVGDLSNADEGSKVLVGKVQTTGGGQSIAFSRPDFTDASGSTLPGNSVVDSSTRTLNLSSGPTRTSHSSMPTVMGTTGAPSNEPSIQARLKYAQQKIKMQEQNEQRRQQHLLVAAAASRSKTATTSNGSAYSEHLTTSSSIAAKFPNALSGFPQNFVQNCNTSNNQAQSPQWKNSTRTPTSQVQSSLASSTSSLKNHTQQQTRTQQSHTQISFGANQKQSSASQGQQPPNSSQSPSPPLMVGSPTHSSISKGASGSPRTTTASTSNKNSQASTLSSQQAKNLPSISSQKSSPAGGRNVPSILGNPHIASSSNAGTKTQQQQLQQQFSKQTLQQAQAAQLFFSNPYLQAQPPHSTSSNASAAGGGYYLQRRRSEQQQLPQGSSASSSTGMLSLCPPVTVSNTSTTDPAKAVAAATAAAASNMKGGGLSTQSILHAAQFAAHSSGNPHQLLPAGFSYVHGVPAAGQVKPVEQKHPAGE